MKYKKSIDKDNWSVPDIALSALLLLTPLFIHDGYYDITFSKFACFFVLSCSGVLLCFIFRHVRHHIHREVSRSLVLKDPMDLWFFLFFLANLMAVVFSDYPYNALVGYAGRYMGFDLMLAVSAVYFFVGKYYILKEREFNLLMLSASVVCVIALLQTFGFNPFSLYTEMDEKDRRIFLSTIGNIDVLSSFISIVFPLAFGLLCFQKNKHIRLAFLLMVLALTFMTQLLSNSDSGYLGIFAACWLMGVYALKKKDRAVRFLLLLIFLCVIAFLVQIFDSAGLLTRQLSMITSFVIKTVLPPAFVLLILAALLMNQVSLEERQMKVLRFVYLGVSLSALAAFLFCCFYYSFVNKTVPLGEWENYLRFSEQWGTERGSIWMMCLQAYQSFSLRHKLFGFGEDTLLIALSLFAKEKMNAMGYLTNNAHNEYIQYLLTIGIFGLVAFLGMVIHACRRLLHCKTDRALTLSLAGALVAYLAQAIVNISQPITTPLFFILLVCARCVERPCRYSKKGEVKHNEKEL